MKHQHTGLFVKGAKVQVKKQYEHDRDFLNFWHLKMNTPYTVVKHFYNVQSGEYCIACSDGGTYPDTFFEEYHR